MDTSLIVTQVGSNNKKIQKTIAYANPAASNADLKTFAQSMTALTNNTFGGATRVDKMDVNEEGGGKKLTPTFEANVSWSSGSGNYTYDGDGEVFGYATDGVGIAPLKIDRVNKTFKVTLNGVTPSVWLYASEGEQYAAATCFCTDSE